MKVYINKNDIDVINDLFEATNSYECLACNRDDDLEIVSFTDHDKQVRKEVCEEIWKEFETILMNKTEDMPVMKVANMINSVLDKVKGETK